MLTSFVFLECSPSITSLAERLLSAHRGGTSSSSAGLPGLSPPCSHLSRSQAFSPGARSSVCRMETLSTPFGPCGSTTGPEQATGQVQKCSVTVPRGRPAPKPFTSLLGRGHEKGTLCRARQGWGLSLSHCFASCWSEREATEGAMTCAALW